MVVEYRMPFALAGGSATTSRASHLHEGTGTKAERSFGPCGSGTVWGKEHVLGRSPLQHNRAPPTMTPRPLSLATRPVLLTPVLLELYAESRPLALLSQRRRPPPSSASAQQSTVAPPSRPSVPPLLQVSRMVVRETAMVSQSWKVGRLGRSMPPPATPEIGASTSLPPVPPLKCRVWLGTVATATVTIVAGALSAILQLPQPLAAPDTAL